jgi:transposase
MFIRVKTNKNSPNQTVQIVENVRIGTVVRQRIVRHVGVARNEMELSKLKDMAEYIKSNMENELQPKLFESDVLAEIAIQARNNAEEDVELKVDLKKLRHQQDIITGIHEIYGQIYSELGFNDLLTKRHQVSSNMMYHMVMSRIANPDSKKASVENLAKDFGCELSLSGVYRMMDFIDDTIISKINKIAYEKAQRLFKEEITAVFYDCTTLYFESFKEDDELMQNGFSKEHKHNQPQVILSLLTTNQGIPIGYDLFEGSTFEGHTLETAVKKLKKEYNLKRIIFTADAAMLSTENQKILESENIEYILGGRIKNTEKKIQQQILKLSDYSEIASNSQYEKLREFNLSENKRILVTYSQKRADKDKRDRDKSIEALYKKISKSKNPASMISNKGFSKYIQIEGEAILKIDQEKIQHSERWDGLHGIVTNVKSMTNEEIIEHYHQLWQIEECFRISKHDLRFRPIYHWTTNRIKAHIGMCFMALVCIKHLTHRVGIQYQKMSAESIQNQLLHVKLSILKHKETEKIYAIPSKITQEIKQIYWLMNKKISDVPYEIK